MARPMEAVGNRCLDTIARYDEVVSVTHITRAARQSIHRTDRIPPLFSQAFPHTAVK
jgi:hypothetical protein